MDLIVGDKKMWQAMTKKKKKKDPLFPFWALVFLGARFTLGDGSFSLVIGLESDEAP